MNVRKRGLALLMCICMIFTLLPFSALADNGTGGATEPEVVYGNYEGNTWKKDDKDPSSSEVTEETEGGNTVKLSKTATPVEGQENTYNIELKVVTTQTSEAKDIGAATVLVIDVSGSMNYCSDCGGNGKHIEDCPNYKEKDRENGVTNAQKRITAAKDAAMDFLFNYSGATKDANGTIGGLKDTDNGEKGLNRFVSVVAFNEKITSDTTWYDVSTKIGYNNVKSVIENLWVKDGTNLDLGLKTANGRFTVDTVKNIKTKNVVVLTDGEPTFYYDKTGVNKHGSAGCPVTNTNTANSAAELKNNASVYTVCFGVSGKECWNSSEWKFVQNSIQQWVSVLPGIGYWETIEGGYCYKFSEWTDYDGTHIWYDNDTKCEGNHTIEAPTVGYFLENSIATPAAGETKYAYTASNRSDLMAVFKAIGDSITQGIKDGIVIDPMGDHFTVVTVPSNFEQTAKGYKWELKDPAIETVDGKTVYTYRLTYTVKLDNTFAEFNEEPYYPTNKETTFTPTGSETSYKFKIPGVKGTAPSYTVTYQYDTTKTLPENAPDLASYNTNNTYKKGTEVKIKDIPTLDGYVFNGWTATVDSNVTINNNAPFTMPNNNVVLQGYWTERTDINYTIEHYWIGDKTTTIGTTETKNDGTLNQTVTVAVADAATIDGYTIIPTQSENIITINADTSKNVIKLYYYKNVGLDASDGTLIYNGEEQTYNATVTCDEPGAQFTGATATATGKDKGEYYTDYSGINLNDVDESGFYIVTRLGNGKLTINPRPLTITGDGYPNPITVPYRESGYAYYGYDNDKAVTDAEGKDNGIGLIDGHVISGISYELKGTEVNTETGYTGVFNDKDKLVINDANGIDVTANYTATYNVGKLFIYKATDAKATIEATKTLDNDAPGNVQFSFKLESTDGKDTRIIPNATNDADGRIKFDLTYDKEDNYIYKLSEVKGTDTGIVYDETVYYVKVEVTLVEKEYKAGVRYFADKACTEQLTTDLPTFNNTTKPGSLTISKTVSGNAASTTKDFTFTVTLTMGGEAMPGEMKYGDTTFINGVAIIKLKHNESVTITGLPDGIKYTVTESDNNGYTVTVDGENTATAKGTITAGETSTAAFKNTKNYVYPPNPPIMDEIIVEITGSSDSVMYDGAEHSVKGYTVKISDPRYTEADFTFTGKAEASGVNAGTYEMGLKAEQFKNTNARFTNVKFVIKADGVLTITPKDLTITAGSKTEYGPTPVTCDEWTVSGLVAGDKVESVKITGIQSVPGSSPNVPSDAVIKNAKGEDVTKNYAIKYVNGTLTMLEVLNKEDHFNYIIGTPEGLSLPTANVTRAEVATIFFRLMTDDARAKFDSLDNNFSDVAKGKWYNRAISTLAKAGIIKGDPAGTYRPGDPITRAEMAAIIARFGDFKEGGKTFSDISGHWAQKYIELAASNGWINGNPDGTFKPNNKITRAETVAMINRVLNRQTESNDDLLPVSQMTNWSDNMDTAKWYYRDMQEATNNHKAERVGTSIYEKWTEKLPDIDWASYQI